MRVAFVVHGFPPHEHAGTETATARLAEALERRGHRVRVLVAAPRAGARQYAIEDDGRVLRLTQNAPYAGLRAAHVDRAAERVVRDTLAAFVPDVVHVQHLQNHGIPSSLDYPTVWTLHDAWAWCAAGGQLFRDGAPCAGPGAACPACASAWSRDPPIVRAALGIAGRLGRWVPPDRLHAAWRRAPAGLRTWATAGAAAPVTAAALRARDAAILNFSRRCSAILAPSAWLADEAVARGLPRPRVVPNGVDPTPSPRNPDGPFVFLGTLAPHKGPHVVVAAHARSGARRGLRLHGPPGPDAAYNARFPGVRALLPADVPRVLAGARALVLGSLWPENAPLVISEARAAGCPVIAPKIGGIPELVEPGRDGALYPPGDVAALAALLRAVDETPLATPSLPFALSAHVDAVESVYKGVAREGA